MCRIGRLGSWLVVMIFDKMKCAWTLKSATKLCITLAESQYDISLPNVTIRFRWLRHYFGQAWCWFDPLLYKAEIKYSLYSISFIKDAPFYMKDTVPHEIAHVVYASLYGFRSEDVKEHGKEWRAIFRSLGGTDKRYFEGGTHYES